MKIVQSVLMLLAAVASSMMASAATIPSFQVGGTTSSLTYGLAFGPGTGPSGVDVTVTFDPATWTVSQLYDVGNSGLGVGDNLIFAGGSIAADRGYLGNYYLDYVMKDLVVFTTSEGTFSYDSKYLGLSPYQDNVSGQYYLDPSIPAYNISDSDLLAYSTGTINGPGGSRPADLLIFVNLIDYFFSGDNSDLSFGSVSWAIYAPAVLPVLPAQVPEPTSMAIFGLGAVGMAYRARRKIKV